MISWLESLAPWGTDCIRAVQGYQSAWLTAFLKAITKVGDKEGYLLAFPAIYWCVNERWGRKMGVLTLGSLAFNSILKELVQIPRPGASGVQVWVVEHSPSFPSGHAQGTLSIWGYLAILWRSWTVRLFLFLLILTVAFSRVYLGAHYPQDILGGWLFALLTLGLFLWFEPQVSRLLNRMPLWVPLILAFVIPGLFWWTHPGHKTLLSICSAWVGINLGMLADVRWLQFSASGILRQRVKRYLGILVVVALFLGLKAALPDNSIGRSIRYGFVGWSITFLVPWLLVQLGWAQTLHNRKGE